MISPILLGLAGGDELRDDDTGKLAASSAEVDVALGGAWLVELALMRRIDVAGRDERAREARLVARNPSPTGDSLLDEALTIVGQKKGKNPQSLVARLGKHLATGWSHHAGKRHVWPMPVGHGPR